MSSTMGFRCSSRLDGTFQKIHIAELEKGANPVRISTSFSSQAAAMQHSFCLYILASDSDSNIIVVDLFRVRMEMSIVETLQFEATANYRYKTIAQSTI